jgi:hypothetical protein
MVFAGVTKSETFFSKLCGLAVASLTLVLLQKLHANMLGMCCSKSSRNYMASLIRPPSYEPKIPCAVRKFHPFFWTSKVNYTVHKGPLLVHSIFD